MKLVIGEIKPPVPETRVSLNLVQDGLGAISLIVKREGKLAQTVLEFEPNGKVRKIKTYEDIGFPTLNGFLVID